MVILISFLPPINEHLWLPFLEYHTAIRFTSLEKWSIPLFVRISLQTLLSKWMCCQCVWSQRGKGVLIVIYPNYSCARTKYSTETISCALTTTHSPYATDARPEKVNCVSSKTPIPQFTVNLSLGISHFWRKFSAPSTQNVPMTTYKCLLGTHESNWIQQWMG